MYLFDTLILLCLCVVEVEVTHSPPQISNQNQRNQKNNCSFEVIDVYRVQPLHTYGTIIWSLSRVHLFFLALVLSFFHAVLMTSRPFLLNGMRH